MVELTERLYRFGIMRRGFDHRTTSCRLITGQLPGLARLIEITRGVVMIGERFRFGLIAQCLRRRVMKNAPPGTQQRFVGGVAHERVAEHITRFRRHPPGDDQVGIDQLVQAAIQLFGLHRGNFGQHRIGKLPSEDCCHLRDLFGVTGCVQARGQQVSQRRRNTFRTRRSLSALHHNPRQLLDEQRDTAASLRYQFDLTAGTASAVSAARASSIVSSRLKRPNSM